MSVVKRKLKIKVPKSAKQWAQLEEAAVEEMGGSYASEIAKAVAKARKAQAEKNRGAYERRVRRGQVDGPPMPAGAK